MRGRAACFIVSALSISGVPPFNGFFSKELIYDAALERFGRIRGKDIHSAQRLGQPDGGDGARGPGGKHPGSEAKGLDELA